MTYVDPHRPALKRTITILEDGAGWRIPPSGDLHATIEAAWETALAMERDTPHPPGISVTTAIEIRPVSARGRMLADAFREARP